jgi:hypothetical protein
MPFSANPESFDHQTLLNLSWNFEIVAPGGLIPLPLSIGSPPALIGGINQRCSLSIPSPANFSEFSSRVTAKSSCSLLRGPIDRDSFASTPAALTPAPLRSPFSGNLVG